MFWSISIGTEANVSCPQIYASGTHVAHLTNLVVNMRDGVISSFAWDNGCQGCGDDECMWSSTYVDIVNKTQNGLHFSQGRPAGRQQGTRQQEGSLAARMIATAEVGESRFLSSHAMISSMQC